jgi:hypothetical protein
MGFDLGKRIARPPAFMPAVALRRGLLSAAAVAIAFSCLVAVGQASWGGNGSGSSYSKARSMPTGNTPTTSITGRNVTVSWTTSSFAGGGPNVSDYTVKRYNTGGTLQTIGASCSGTISALTCTENNVPSGSWKYSVTPKAGSNWVGTEGSQSTTQVVNAASYTLSSSSTLKSLPQTLSGNLADFMTGQTVTYRLDNPTTGTVLSATTTPSTIGTNGAATNSVTVPAGTSNGSHTIYAIGSAGDQASVSITVDTLAYFGTGAAASRTSAGAMTVNYPASTTTNDLLILTEINSANQAITAPAGWTQLADQATSSPAQMRFTVWYKLAAAETSVSLSVSTNGSGASAWVTAYRRPSASPAPSLATATVRQGVNGATATLTPSPDVTTNANNATAISIVGIRAANTLSLSTPRSFGLSFAGTNSTRALGFADISVPTSGTAPPSPTWSQSGTAAQWAWATAAFK